MAFPNHFMLSILCLTSLALFSFDSYSAQAVSSTDAPSLIFQVCKEVKNKNFCATTFKSDPSAATADLRGLASFIFSQSLSVANANSGSIVGLLVRYRGNARVTQALNLCEGSYTKAIGALQKSIANLRDNNIIIVKTLVGVATQTTNICEQAFIQVQTKTPLADENNKLHQLSEISDVIVRMLK